MSIYQICGAIGFGSVIGYLAWHAIRLEPNKKLRLERVAVFIGVVAGAAIMAVFPSGTEMFATYAASLSITFFISELLWYLTTKTPEAKKRQDALDKQRRWNRQQEWVDNNWSVVEHFIRSRFNRFDEVSVKICQEIALDNEIIEYALKRYALMNAEKEHIAWLPYTWVEKIWMEGLEAPCPIPTYSITFPMEDLFTLKNLRKERQHSVNRNLKVDS